MTIEMIEAFARLHEQLSNLYADAAVEAADDGESHDLDMLSLHHDLEAGNWHEKAQRWHHAAAKMSATYTV